MFQAKNPTEVIMNPNQQAILNFLNALKKYHSEEYLWLYQNGKYSLMKLLNLVGERCIPATWSNQAKQAIILLSEMETNATRP